MMNQAVMESLYSCTYVEDYIDACENLPDDIQRQLTRMREMDATCQGYLREAHIYTDKLLGLQTAGDSEAVQREVSTVSWRLQQLLISAQEIGDDKLQIAQQIQDYVDNKARQLDLDKKNLGIDSGPPECSSSSTSADNVLGSSRDRDGRQQSHSQQQNGPPERNTIIKRARRARHEVYVPSILGPSTLAPTRFTSDEQKIVKKSDGSSKTATSSASTPSKENQPSTATPMVIGVTAPPPSTSTSKPSFITKGAAKMDHVTSSPMKMKSAKIAKMKKENRNSNGNKKHTAASATATMAEPVTATGPISTMDHSKSATTAAVVSVSASASSSATPKTEKSKETVIAVTAEVKGTSTPTASATASATSTPTTSAYTPKAVATPTTSATPSKSTSSSAKQEKDAKMKKKAAEVERKKMKKKKTRQQSDSPPNIPDVDPDEPTYCLCDQVSYGDMIGCDNDLCPIEWFHFSCVSLSTKPKGKWYCPKCRGDRPNVMKPKAIFLKELEKYNREKEEKN